MRERAKAARVGPWEADPDAEMWKNPIVIGPEYPAEEEGSTHRFVIAQCHGFSKPQNAGHIASWHPAVALAVAELISVVAAEFEHGDHSEDWEPYEASVDLAAAYLGRQP